MTRQAEAAFAHGMADVEPGVRLHYVTAGEGDRTAVLLHGFPQTWYALHGFIPRLTTAGFRVIAPDYRGDCDSENNRANLKRDGGRHRCQSV